LIVSGVDTDVSQFFLDEMAKAVPRREEMRQLLVVDNASWHKATRLNWHHFEPVFLPSYSPDFNPIERLWLRLNADLVLGLLCTNIRRTDRTSLRRSQKLYGSTLKNRFHLHHPEITIENHSS